MDKFYELGWDIWFESVSNQKYESLFNIIQIRSIFIPVWPYCGGESSFFWYWNQWIVFIIYSAKILYLKCLFEI